MKIYDFKDFNKLYVIGDIHGEFRTLFYYLKKGLKYDINEFNEKVWENKIDNEFKYDRLKEDEYSPHPILKENINKEKYNNSIIIVAGDCGFGFNKKQYYIDILKKYDKILESCNTHLLFVRGNHDDPEYFKNDILNFNNIICIDDYSVVITKNFNTLCVGGGLSIDRTWRIKEEDKINLNKKGNNKKILYWKDEMPIFNAFELNKIKLEGIKIDSIITHTAPSFIFPKLKNSSKEWCSVDENLKNDLKKEREVMDNIFKYFYENKNYSIKFWAHGHFHRFDTQVHYGIYFLSLDELMIYSINDISFNLTKEKKINKLTEILEDIYL